jgi:alkylation response protein AidB-like acyl-CoA dehydrogenase
MVGASALRAGSPHDLPAEANELRTAVATLLARKYPKTALYEQIDRNVGYDPETWRIMSDQLGLAGLMIPAELGGQGSSFVEASAVLEELAYALFAGPYLTSSILAPAALLLAADHAASAELLESMAAGKQTAAVAFSDLKDPVSAAAAIRAESSGNAWTLNGDAAPVLDGSSADVILVVASTAPGLGLFVVDPTHAHIDLSPLQVLDLTRPAARLTLRDVSARRVGGDFSSAEQTLLSLGAACMAAEAAGATRRVLEMAVEYAQVRRQFGQPIGSFQAVQHLCADIFVSAESASAVARHAARAYAGPREDFLQAASVAKAYASDACVTAAEKNIQIHGGIGFTWEHPAHLYLRKAKACQLLFGNAAAHRHLLACLTGLAE